MAGALGVGLVVGDTLVAQHVAVVIDPCPHHAGAQGHVFHTLERGEGFIHELIHRLAIDLAAIHGRAAAPMGGLFHDQHVGTGFGRGFRRLKAGDAAADDGDVDKGIEMLVGVVVTAPGCFAETCRLADEGLVDVFPERAGMHEHLVVEARRQEAREELGVDLAHVEFEARPVVLAFDGEAVEELGRGGALVGLEAGALAHVEERVGLFHAGGDDAAGAVVLERPPDQHLVIGQQRRGERVARDPTEVLAVEGEFQRLALVQKPPARGKARAHANSLQLQPGRLAEILSLMSFGGSVVWAG